MNALSHAALLCACGILLSALLRGEVTTKASRPPPGTPPTPATRQEVWEAVVSELRQRGLSERQLPQIEDLDLPGALPVLTGRELRVSSACWDERPRRTQFRLECGELGQCLPFFVYLHSDLHNTGLYDPANTDAIPRAGACQPTLVRVAT